ncbi:hypothetical protein EG346_15505 [Chryseobacterium carnipullorum]|uniref:Uncharacterized protein n=1 Tax=Chryseobacterium carnipullorum TaxID=1124835 RepID=A0A376DRY4_CHRCU|nr:hypothetical protein [Chryseobacterium carnipullorum]AZA49495.1 hypothetical protein EG346_15505 [Chryseobacterium carnipullorum]STC94518.1 Uncharacterised protein [Chryseobacterium carnipullorum]
MNPFEVKTPEDVTATEVHELFVDVFTDFYQVKEIGHTFLNGPRGSGKSMMFRYMMPDCQIIDKNCTIDKLDYFSLYVPVKLTDINYPELERLKSNSNTFFNEHLLTTYVAIKCFKHLLDFHVDLDKSTIEIKEFYDDVFLWYVDISGEDISKYKVDFATGTKYFESIIKILEKMLLECKGYCRKIAFAPDKYDEYKGALCNYLDFLYPILLKLKELPFMPKSKPLFLLIDDAGYLNFTQTKILNTWVSYRTSKFVSLKISTQLDYKSYNTINEKTIDYPHDYSQINIATVYTSSGRNYYQRIESIVTKRIKKYLGKDVLPKDFFPPDLKQEDSISKKYDQIKEQFTKEDKKYAGPDAARRYATSEYVKGLVAGRSGGTFSYAGFDNLVNISSGIIRYFLEPASTMFSESLSRNNKEASDILYIPDNIQNDIINEFSQKFLEDEFKKVIEQHGEKSSSERLSKADKLYNLITGLGGMFRKIFVSDRTERVVFSVALNDLPDEELKEILELAIHYGYLHQSTIGNKQGTGRSKLFILSRTLAPYFKLDPTGFKGYKFMNSDLLKTSLTNPQSFITNATKSFSSNGGVQQSLFDNIED